MTEQCKCPDTIGCGLASFLGAVIFMVSLITALVIKDTRPTAVRGHPGIYLWDGYYHKITRVNDRFSEDKEGH